MMATSASLPFFVFTLPAGAISDVVNRQNLFIGTYLWLAGAAGLLAVCTWLNLVHPYLILVTVFLLGIGFAFNAPVWASIVPDIVRKEELAFGLFIAVVPALLPLVAFQHLHLAAIQLGLVFTSLGIGSLLGATLVLPYARTKATPNMLTILASLILVSVFIFTAIVPNLWIFLPVAALAGISWTMSASELWTAGR
jgi:MFS family permease